MSENYTIILSMRAFNQFTPLAHVWAQICTQLFITDFLSHLKAAGSALLQSQSPMAVIFALGNDKDLVFIDKTSSARGVNWLNALTESMYTEH